MATVILQCDECKSWATVTVPQLPFDFEEFREFMVELAAHTGWAGLTLHFIGVCPNCEVA